MAFNPTLPIENTPLDAAQMRDQFNGLKAIIDDLQNQLAPTVPVLARDNSGNWTLNYNLTPPLYWLVWARTDISPVWQFFTEVTFADFPLSDGDLVPPGNWWQVKIAGENAAGVPATPFSNVVASANAPA